MSMVTPLENPFSPKPRDKEPKVSVKYKGLATYQMFFNNDPTFIFDFIMERQSFCSFAFIWRKCFVVFK